MSASLGPFERIEVISRSHDLTTFDCGNPDFNDFIRNDAVSDLAEGDSVTYIGFREGRPIAFVSLIAAAYQTRMISGIDQGEYKYNQVPAIKIARLATDLTCQKAGCGRFFLDYSVAIALQVRRFIGCRLVVTDALPDKVGWYSKHGFNLSMTLDGPRARKNYPMYQVLPRVEPR